MQVALISDIHGNVEALDATLRDIDRRAPGAKIVCAGDIVGYGPDPGACITRLSSRSISSVMGNHDEMVLGRRGFSRCVYAGIVAARWTRRNLSPELLRYLDGLPDVVQVTPTIVACHGTPDDADAYVSNEQSAKTALDQLKKRFPDARLLVCGHTHHAALYREDSGFQLMAPGTDSEIPRHGYAVINPGAVGQSRDGTIMARYALLNTDDGRVSFLGQEYEHAVTVRKLRRAGLVPVVDMQRPTGLARYLSAIRKRWAKFRCKTNPRFG